MSERHLTKRDRSRRSVIIAELSRLSRDGWENATSVDWHPLEAELTAINSKSLRRITK